MLRSILYSCFLLNLCILNAQTYNYYRGNLHSHTIYSDGNSSNVPYYSNAGKCFQFADSSLQFDFLGISEHNHGGAGMSLANYPNGINEAISNTNASFLSLYGMEWGTISGGGHVVIYGVDSLMGWEAGNYSILTPFGDYTGLFNQINNRPSSFCYLAHPDIADFNGIFSSPYNAVSDAAIIGVAVRSGPAFSTDVSYTNPSTFSYYQRYKDLLALGYHVGPLIDHDNHNITFGRHTPARTVILSPTLSKTDIFNSIESMRFYASEDWNVEVSFTLNTTNPMGQIVTGTTNPTLSVTVNDPDGEALNYIRVRYAIQSGGNTSPAILTSTAGNTLNYTHSIANGDAYYYFLEIQQADGNMIYSSPIWYTKITSLPVELIEFKGEYRQPEDDVSLLWSTASEYNSDYFEIERSTDGINWVKLSQIEAHGNSSKQIDYNLQDEQPYFGLNYYRLSEYDIDGSLKVQRITSVMRELDHHFDLYPNPASTEIYIAPYRGIGFEYYEIYNSTGGLMEAGKLNNEITRVSTIGWMKGNYLVRLYNGFQSETGVFVVD